MDQRMLQKLIADAQKNKKILDKKLSELESQVFEEKVGKDYVQLKANGKFELLSCKISDQLLAEKDMLEEVLIDCFNKLIKKIKEEHEKAQSSIMPGKFF